VRPSDILLTDQIAIVTGGGAGIGQGVAIGLAEFGANVVIAEIDSQRAEVTADVVRNAGREALVVPTDVTDTDQIREMVDAARRHFGRIDILVNNAGGARRQPFMEQGEPSWRRDIDSNLVSMVAATAAVAPLMIASGRGGSIVNVAGIEALRASPGFAVHAACKAAMANFTRTMALELAHHQIRVNAIAPDVIETPGARGIVTGPVPSPLPALSPDIEAGLHQYVPLGGEGEEEDCAAAVVFLSSRMARYISGVTLSVDGGTWASSGWSRTSDGSSWQVYPGFDSIPAPSTKAR